MPCGSVREVGDVLQDPQLDARQMIETVEHMTAGAVRVSGSRSSCRILPAGSEPRRRHSGSTHDRILEGECGMSAGQIEEMKRTAGI